MARWGGEEIIVGLPGADIEDAFNFAEDVRKKLEDSRLEVGLPGSPPARAPLGTRVGDLGNSVEEVKFTISGGVAGFHEAGDFESLFKNADTALYEAKNSGKNRIVKFKSDN